MDSDEDGAYGYDMPEDSGPGFQIRMKRPASDDDSLDDGRKQMGNSSDEDDPNFAYGAYGKKRQREGFSEKERNLYGVFYDDSDEERQTKRRARHFDKGKNRQAGLAFVKASESASNEKGDGEKDAVETPSWLKDTKQNISDDAKHVENKSEATPSITKDLEESDAEMGEEEMKQINDSEARFKELLALANTTKRQASFQTMKRKRPVQKTSVKEATAPDLGRSSVDEFGLSGGLGFATSKLDDDEGNKAAATGGASTIDNTNNIAGLKFDAPIGLGSVPQQRMQMNEPEPSSGMGMGLGSTFPGFQSMGFQGLGMGNSNNTAKKRDPSLGKWEKHTKGIGMKLLSKMGYEGSGGLGAKRKRKAVVTSAATDESADQQDTKDTSSDVGYAAGLGFKEAAEHKPSAGNEEEGKVKRGISRPVEVVVRPAGLGLGYGSFKEASQLKVNRQIEAEVRGLDLEKTEPDESKKDANKEKSVFDGIPKSLLPTTESLLTKRSQRWRKGAKSKKTKPKIVNYKDIISQASANESVKVIDMRGPSAVQAAPTDESESAPVPLGEELLHNVSLLLNAHENQLRTASYMVNTTQKKLESLESERQEMSQRRVEITGRIEKMKLALKVIDEADHLGERLRSMQKDKQTSSLDTLDFVLNSTQKMLTDLISNFTTEERKSLKFDSTLVPALVKPLINQVLSSLDPFRVDNVWMSRLSVGIKEMCASSDDEVHPVRRLAFLNCVAPWIEKSLSSSRWDPVVDSESGLLLYEQLLSSVHESFSDLGSETQFEENEIVKESLNDEIIRNIIHPKLHRCVTHLKPKLNSDGKVANPMHLWILHWLPHFSRDLMITMLDEVRRKLKSTLSLLGKTEQSGIDYCTSCMHTLEPWTKLFGAETMFAITSDVVTPRFARALSRIKISFLPTQQDWSKISALFQYFDHRLMSVDDFVSLIEGEVLPAWANTLYFELKKKSQHMIAFKEFYVAWKNHLLASVTHAKKISNASLVLQSESMVCRYFFGGLEMIEAALESNDDFFDTLQPPNPADCNYRITLMHRAKTAKVREAETSLFNGNARVAAVARDGSKNASFQEVVADFAKQHDMEFFPKTGSNSMKDGKPVFMLGGHPVYFHKDVIFSLRGSSWQPISLEHLAQTC